MWYHSIPCFSFLSLIPFFLSPLLVFFRLCWVWRWDQAGPVSPRPGETVACELFQMSDLQHGPNRRVHQQVSGHQTPKLLPSLPASPPLEAKHVSDTLHSFGLFLWQGWSSVLWGRLPCPVWGEMRDLQQIHQWKGSGGETKPQRQALLTL